MESQTVMRGMEARNRLKKKKKIFKVVRKANYLTVRWKDPVSKTVQLSFLHFFSRVPYIQTFSALEYKKN